jgi:hypothetical protein
LTYESDDPESLRFYQLVPVTPGDYLLEFDVKAEDLLTTSGPEIGVSDAYSGNEVAKSEDFLGTFPWQHITLRLKVAPKTVLLKLALIRRSPASSIQGHLWLDNFSLRSVDGAH